jgi:hypothetical protein
VFIRQKENLNMTLLLGHLRVYNAFKAITLHLPGRSRWGEVQLGLGMFLCVRTRATSAKLELSGAALNVTA